MAQENVEVIRRLEAAFNDQDIQGALATMHPDVELELIGGFADIMGQDIFNGSAGMRRFLTDWYATFKTMYTQQEQDFKITDDQVLVLSRFHATVEGSDVPVELPVGSIFTFEDGKIIRLAAYYDRKEALEAAGLSEQDVQAEP
jgi:ketosteroid isomerase-like protein